MKRLLLLAAAAVVCQAQAVVVYDDTTTGLGSYYNIMTADTVNSNEVGDEVVLAGTERYVTDFTVALYHAGTAQTSTFDLTLRFYANDAGQNLDPGTLLYDSGAINLTQASGATAYSLALPNVLVLDDFTWTVQITSRTGSADKMGLLLYDPPTVGSSSNWFYQKNYNASTWAAYWFGETGPVSNFYSKIEAQAVPEPASMLALGAGLAALAARRRRK